MRYFKQRGCCLRRDSLAASWGECIRYVEIGDDRYAVRQVEVYNSGRVLRYERSHWCDRFGQLFGCLFSQKHKAIDGRLTAEVIDAKEFERAWREAIDSPMWVQQVEHSLVAEWGLVPHWLRKAQHPEQEVAPDSGRVMESRGSRSPRRHSRRV
ncbi:DUF6881 domain-containing protein [Planctopirus hydrillae]